MVVTEFRSDLPDWVMQNIMMRCSYCGAYLFDNSDSGVTTARFCINPACPGHMQHKIKFLADYFDIKGIGPAKALDLIRMLKLKNHLDILPVWFDVKPVVSLADVAVLACIDGYGNTKAQQELNQYSCFEDYFENSLEVDSTLSKNRDYLIKCQHYFTIKKPLSQLKLYVMATGSFHGYSNRNDLFTELNDTYGGVLQIIQTGKRKTGISYLVKERDAIDHSKSQIAYENNIPIITPDELKLIVEKTVQYIIENNIGGYGSENL